MLRSHRSRLVASTSVLAIALSTPFAASAQESQQAQANRLEEITVTARRIEENVQRVPLAVIAMSEEKLQTQNIVNLMDFQKATPGLVTQAGYQGTWFWLRGLQGVARFFADAPADPAFTGAMFDVDNVQVLKGPQGTLFGGSSVAGAIVSNPKKPTEELTGYANVVLGDYGRRTIGGAVGGPIVEDKLLFRVAFNSLSRDGFMCARNTGKCYNDENQYVFRPSFTLRPTESVESYTMVQYFYERTNGPVTNLVDYAPKTTDSYAVTARNAVFNFGPVRGPQILDELLAQAKYRPYEIDNQLPQPGFSGLKKREIMVINNTSWDITDNISIRNIFQWRKNGIKTFTDARADGIINFDPRAIEVKLRPLEMQTTWSDEFKINGRFFDDLVDVTLGTYHKGEPTVMSLGFSNPNNIQQASYTKGSQRYPTLTRAVFGQAEFDVGRYVNLEGLSFTAGYRQTWDTMSAITIRLTVPAGVPTAQLKSRQDLYGKAYFSNENWLFGLKWQYNPDTMFYFTAAKAYTVGQTNPQFGPPYEKTDPEILKQLEGGMKSSFFLGDIQLRTNLAVYYGWYSNIQVSVLRSAQLNPPPAPPTTIVPSVNAAEGLTRGFDAELTIVPTDWFEFSANAAYNKNKYTDWPVLHPTTGAVIGNQKNTVYVGTPKLVWNLTGTFHVPMDEEYGRLSVSATYMHTAATHYYAGANIGAFVAYSTHNAANGYGPLSSDGAVVPNSSNKPYHNLDASVRWANPMDIQGLSATFGISNITKNLEGANGGYGYYAAGFRTATPNTPRMFTLDLRYSF
jgi:iron complex outermembrane receptor protein